jgi:hypothetical protein
MHDNYACGCPGLFGEPYNKWKPMRSCNILKKSLLAIIMLAVILTVPAQGFCSSANSVSSYKKESGIGTFVGTTGDVLIGVGGIVGMVGLGLMASSILTVVGMPVGLMIGYPIAVSGGLMMITGYAMAWYHFLYDCFIRS